MSTPWKIKPKNYIKSILDVILRFYLPWRAHANKIRPKIIYRLGLIRRFNVFSMLPLLCNVLIQTLLTKILWAVCVESFDGKIYMINI